MSFLFMPTVFFISDSVFKCVSFWSTSFFLSFVSLGHLVKTEYMLNLVTECEVSLTFNGNNLHEYIPGHTHPLQFVILC